MDPEVDEAQHIIEIAAKGGYFDHITEGKGHSDTIYTQLKAAALDLLGTRYPGLYISIINYPGSYYIDLKVSRRGGLPPK